MFALHALILAVLAHAGPAHDFDFEIGTWNIAVRKLAHPLSGSHRWIEPRGYVHIVKKVWDGQASLAQLEVLRPTPHYLGLMLRLYDPQRQHWSIYWASAADGAMSAPLVGSFSGGRGTFYGHDTWNGKPILVRVVYTDIASDSFRTEQAFSADGGATWETNLIQSFTRR